MKLKCCVSLQNVQVCDPEMNLGLVATLRLNVAMKEELSTERGKRSLIVVPKPGTKSFLNILNKGINFQLLFSPAFFYTPLKTTHQDFYVAVHNHQTAHCYRSIC